MTNFHVYCEVHGVVASGFTTREEALKSMNDHLRNGDTPHGKVSVIQKTTKQKYGNNEIKFVQVYARYKK